MATQRKINKLQLARWLLYYITTMLIGFFKRMVGIKDNNGALNKIKNLPPNQRSYLLSDEIKTNMEDLILYNCGFLKKKNGICLVSISSKRVPRA